MNIRIETCVFMEYIRIVIKVGSSLMSFENGYIY